MKLMVLVLLALFDAALRLALNRYVFKDMTHAWQLWGALFYAMWPVNAYMEIMGGRGVVQFPLESMHPVSFGGVIAVTGGMVIFHILAFTSLFDRWRR